MKKENYNTTRTHVPITRSTTYALLVRVNSNNGKLVTNKATPKNQHMRCVLLNIACYNKHK